jgi:ribonuclease G
VRTPAERMARNILVINCDLRETRVALIEEGVIAELQIERANSRGTVGNVVLGKVSRVLPGMQAAFIEVGMERAAFLHVEDLIRPADFEAYLSGGRRPDDDEPSGKGEGGRRRIGAAVGLEPDEVEVDGDDDDDDDDEELIAARSSTAIEIPGESEVDDDVPDEDDPDEIDDDESLTDAAPLPDGEAAAADAYDEAPLVDDEAPLVDDEAPLVDDEAPLVDDEAPLADDEAPLADDEAPLADDELAAGDPAIAAAIAGQEQIAAVVSPVSVQVDPDQRRRRRRRRRGRRDEAPGGNGAAKPAVKPASKARAAAPERGGRNQRGRKTTPLRVSRSVPITEVVKEGDEVIVQISKEPLGTKGARVTSHVSLPGRYVVFLPTVDHIGISKRIGSARERQRLREVIEQVKPPQGGLIVRTVAEGLTKKKLKADIGYLVRLWREVAKRHESSKSPALLYAELDLVLKTARDYFGDEIEKIVIDDREQHSRLQRFVEMFMPERVKDIELYTGDEPIFDAFGIEDEIGRALSRKVPLPSGGYLIIDQAEALTAIDVNTGRFVGRGSKDLEETALKTNLEAVEEIAYQLRFRNIGGLIILDLIDMDLGGNREKVWRALEQRLAKDKAKTTLNRISELGLIEMTRKRTRESLSRSLNEPCFYCDGTGQIQSRTTIAYEILRQIRRERQHLPGYVVVVNAHPAVVDLLAGEEKAAVADAERRYMRRIELVARREYHIEQFDLQGK